MRQPDLIVLKPSMIPKKIKQAAIIKAKSFFEPRFGPGMITTSRIQS